MNSTQLAQMKIPPTARIVLGVDPGFTGALAIVAFGLDPEPRLISVLDMPIKTLSSLSSGPKPKPIIDLAQLVAWLEPFVARLDLAVVEAVHAAPDQGVSSMFRFGQGLGQIEGVLAAMKVRTTKPPPAVWKTSMCVPADKKKALEIARGLVPTAQDHLTRVKDHGRAEAILLAVYGARSLGWGSFLARA